MTEPSSPTVAAVIPAKDEADRIAATVRAVRGIPGVDLVVVVDDGSSDGTAEIAREAGAEVVRHARNRGKAAAMTTGAGYVARHEGVEGRVGSVAVAPRVPSGGDRCCSSTATWRPPPPTSASWCRPSSRGAPT